MFQPGPVSFVLPGIATETKVDVKKPCKHLRGKEYDEYIQRIQTRSLGGISPTIRGQVSRQLFPYKPFPPLKNDLGQPANHSDNPEMNHAPVVPGTPESMVIPNDGNEEIEHRHWTKSEVKKHDQALMGWARWITDRMNGFIRSTCCECVTSNKDGVCDACKAIAKDESFQRSVRRVSEHNCCVIWSSGSCRHEQKNAESKLSANEQHEVLKRRGKHTANHLLATDARNLDAQLKDATVFAAFQSLKDEDNTKCFTGLYKAAIDGKLGDHKVFHQLCEVFHDRLQREGSDNKNKKFGVRYKVDYLNFMIAMRSRGGETGKQYGILTGELGGPSPRQIRCAY